MGLRSNPTLGSEPRSAYVRAEIVLTRRNTKAAQRLLRRRLRKQGVAPKCMVTEKLRP